MDSVPRALVKVAGVRRGVHIARFQFLVPFVSVPLLQQVILMLPCDYLSGIAERAASSAVSLNTATLQKISAHLIKCQRALAVARSIGRSFQK